MDQMAPTEAGAANPFDLNEEDAQEAAEKARQQRAEILDALGMRLSRTRSEAINARRQSGIEDEWIEDEEFYEGIDDANRGEKGVRMAAWRSKPAGQAEPAITGTGSTVFVNITRPYCDAAAARVADMLLPTDDRAWSIQPTPYPELVGMAEGELPERIQRQIAAANPGQTPEDRAIFDQRTRGDIQAEMKKLLDAAREKADRAQRRIEDWHVQSQYHAEVRRVIEDATKSGTGVLKGPIPMRRKTVAFIDGKITIKEEVAPFSKRVDKWNLFPDRDCGDSIHRGSYLWERDEITRKALEGLKGGDYLDDQIDAVLKEGPHKATPEWERDGKTDLTGLVPGEGENLFEIWYGYCRATAEDLQAAGLECDEGKSYDVMLTLVNNRVIKANLNHLDTGEFPYDVYVWQRREGMWCGVGVARHIRVPQRIVVGAVRNLLDNAGLSGRPMVIMKRNMVTPANGVYEIVAGKLWFSNEDDTIDDVAKAFTVIEIPMLQDALLNIVQFGMKLAEDVTGLPLLMQGQQGNAPETVGGMQILNNNAGTVLRRVAKLFDDLITEPHVRRYYAYLLQYGDDEEKGDFLIDARGSSALVERDLQNQYIMQMGNLVVNPIFGKDPKKWMDENLKANRLDPGRFDYDDEEWQKVVANMSQPPPNPSVEVANIRGQVQMQVEAARAKHDAEQRERDRELEIAFKGLDQELEKAIQQGGTADVLTMVKARLTDTAMKLQAQRDLSAREAVGRQVATPAVEPRGRAPDGQAFQR